MPAIAIVGAQWGDEGKGKVTDLYAAEADVVVRFGGGPNAGHTLVVPGRDGKGSEKVILRLLPSGILQPGAECVMAQGMVVDLGVLVREIDELEGRGVSVAGRLFLASRAHVVLPHHPLVDGLREAAAGAKKIGTTKRGIGPCYEDKAARRGLRVGDLAEPRLARERVAASLEAWAPTIRALGAEPPRVDDVMEVLLPLAARLSPLVCDTSARVDRALAEGKRVLFEGAQGVMLDLDHGTYPFVTSSAAVAAGAALGAGVGPRRIERVVGLAKAYATRVGEGPFPTELEDETGERIRQAGGEFGSVTGRPRRCGWLDLPALRYAARVSGLDALALTKLDVLTGLPLLRVCVAYGTRGGRSEDFPVDEIALGRPVHPLYEELEGFEGSLEGCRRLEDLPRPARAYLDFVERSLGLPLDLVSVSPARDATILRRRPFEAGGARGA